MYQNPQSRRGAALIVAIVLLAVLGIIAGLTLPQIIRDRYEARIDLIRIQSRQLLDDALRIAEAKRTADPEFSGETLTLTPDQQPFAGTFKVTTRYENDTFVGEVEYRDENDKVLMIQSRNRKIAY